MSNSNDSNISITIDHTISVVDNGNNGNNGNEINSRKSVRRQSYGDPHALELVNQQNKAFEKYNEYLRNFTINCYNHHAFWLLSASLTMLEPILIAREPVNWNILAQRIILGICTLLFFIQTYAEVCINWVTIENEEKTVNTGVPFLNRTYAIFTFYYMQGEYVLEVCCFIVGWATIFQRPGFAGLRCYRVFRLLWYYEVECLRTFIYSLLGEKYHVQILRVFKVTKFASEALLSFATDLFFLTDQTKGALIIMAIFFYSAYVLGAVLWQETAYFSGDYCQSAGLCAYTLMRLTFYDGEGFDFFIAIWRNGHQFLFFITGVYLCSTAFGLLNGLVGIFASSFTSGTINNKYDDIDLLPKHHRKTGKYRNIVGAVACALCPLDPDQMGDQALHPSLTKAYGEIAKEAVELEKEVRPDISRQASTSSTYKSSAKDASSTLFQVPKNDPRNRSHSVHSIDELDERRKEEEDFKKIVSNMFKELDTERKDQRKKLDDLEKYILEIKSESAQLLEIIKELRDTKKEGNTDIDDKHALSGKVAEQKSK